MKDDFGFMEFKATEQGEANEMGGGRLTDTSEETQQRFHPNVLLVYWEMYSRTQQWASALSVAESMVIHLPQEPISWIYRSFALHQLGRVSEAWEELGRRDREE